MTLAPRTIRNTRTYLLMLAPAHVVILIAVWWNGDDLRRELAAANPGLPYETVAGASLLALTTSTAYHLTFAALDAWLLRLLWLGRGQVAITVVQAIALLTSPVAWWAAASGFDVAILLLTLAALGVLGHVWTPSARTFFRAAVPRLPSTR